METQNNSEMRNYQETHELELELYKTEDDKGREVVINLKKVDEHQSHHPWEQHPTFFYNLGSILKDYDRANPTDSNNPQAQKHASEGEIIIYEKDEFLKKLDAPFMEGESGDTVTVVVKYDEEKNFNYTLTYRIDKI